MTKQCQVRRNRFPQEQTARAEAKLISPVTAMLGCAIFFLSVEPSLRGWICLVHLCAVYASTEIIQRGTERGELFLCVTAIVVNSTVNPLLEGG